MHARIDTLILTALLALPAAAQTTTLESKDSAGQAGNGESFGAAMTPDGRFVAFASKASDLVASDTNGCSDVFVRDRQSGAIERLSIGATGSEGNGDSGPSWLGTGHLAISDDGRYVAFVSKATNLVLGDTNGKSDVFVRDRVQNVIVRISEPGGGGNADGDSGLFGSTTWMSRDGRYVVFDSIADNLIGTTPSVMHVYRWDRVTGVLAGVSANVNGVPGDASSSTPSVSGDGRFVAFESSATNLLPGVPPGVQQVVVRDMTTGVVSPVSVSSGGTWGGADSYCDQISRDARYVVFTSTASNLVVNDSNGARDVFVRDFWALSTRRVSVGASGLQANAGSSQGSISEFGRFVSFRTSATNLVLGFGAGDGHDDVLRKDLVAGGLEPISVTPGGMQAGGESTGGLLSFDGRRCLFTSKAGDLVVPATNTAGNVYLREVESCADPVAFCVGTPSSVGCTPAIASSGTPSLGDAQHLIVRASDIVNKTLGILAYSTSGYALTPFGGGVLCLASPIRRCTAVQSGGSPTGVDCTGQLAFDFEAFAGNGADPNLVAGAVVDAQWWYRDKTSSSGVGLSDALQFELCP